MLFTALLAGRSKGARRVHRACAGAADSGSERRKRLVKHPIYYHSEMIAARKPYPKKYSLLDPVKYLRAAAEPDPGIR